MARMSVDDKFLRDPRVAVLGKLCGWSVRETRGCLLDVWAVCYDQVTPLLSRAMIDVAACLDGFSEKLVEAELGTLDRSGKIRIEGATKRIEYLDHKKNAGRQGGLKSAETRDKEVKQTSSKRGSTPQAVGNLILTVPDTASASVPDEVPDPESESPRARSSHPEPTPRPQPEDPSPPEPSPEAIAQAPTLAISAPIAQATVARMGAVPPVGWTHLGDRLWLALGGEFRELAKAGVAGARDNAWNGHPDKLIGQRLGELRERGFSLADAERYMRDAWSSATTKARKTNSLRYLVPPYFLAENSLKISATTPPDDAPRTRGDGMQPMPGPPRGDEPELPDRSGDPFWQQGPGDQSPEGKAARAAARAIKLAALIAKTEADRANVVPLRLGGDS